MAQATLEGPDGDNAASDYEDYREQTNSLEVQKFLDAEFGIVREEIAEKDPLQFVKEKVAPATAEPIDAKISLTKTIAKNIVEIPMQSAGGPIDAFNEFLEFTGDIGDVLTKMGLPSSFLQITNPEGELDIRFLKPGEKDLAEAAGFLTVPQLPAPGKAGTPTGEMAREITKFLAGFIPAVRAVKALKGTQKAGTTVIEATTAAAISAAVARDPHEARLATFLNDVPWLSEIVPDYLADNNPQNESAWEGRLKNAVDEAGFGLVADGLISSFKFYKAQRKAKRLAREEQDVFDKERIKQEELEAFAKNAPEITEEQLLGLGDPASDKMFSRIKAAEERVGEAVPKKDVDLPTTQELVPLIPGKLVGSRIIDFGFGDKRLLLEFDKSAKIPTEKDLEELIKSVIGNKNLVIEQISLKRGGFSTAVRGFERFHIQFKGRTGSLNDTDLNELLGELTGGRVSEKTAKELSRQPKPKPAAQEERVLLESATEKAGIIPPAQGDIFINMAKIDTPDDVRKLIKDVADADAEAINKKRGGAKKSLSKMIEESDDAFMDIKDLIGRDPGPMTAAQAIASRKILASSADQLVVLAKKANAPEATQADLYAFRRGMAVHYAIQSEVVAARTETARALRSWAIPVGTDQQRGEAIAELINATNGAASTKKMAKALANVGHNLRGVNLMAEQFSRPKISDVVYQIWINGILSGPPAQIVNILGNGIKAAYVIPRTLVDASISKAFYDGEISYLEATSAAFGMVKGFRNGIRLLWHGNKATDIGDLKAQFEQFSKIEGTHGNIITAEAFGVGPESAFGRGIDFMGRALNIPTSMLRGADTLFKAIGYQMEVQKRAMRQGLSEGLDGDDLARRIQEMTDNPPPALKADAISVAHYQTFTNPLGEKGRKLVTGLRAFPGVRYIIPFTRTFTNIFVNTWKGTPLALISRQVRADMAAGGTRAAQAWGRIGTGSIMMLAAADMAMEGTITGKGPSDSRLKANLLRTGWKPYSVKLGGVYIPFNRAEPIGNFLAIGADIAEVINNLDSPDADFLVSTMVMGLAENLKSKTYLQGIVGAITAFDPANPMKTPEEWAARFAPSLMPFSSFFRQLAKAADPTLKITETAPGDPNLIKGFDEKTAVYLEEVLNEFRSRVPGYSGNLFLRRDLWGREITRASGYGMAFDLLSPIYASVEKPDPIEKILIDNEIPISHVSREIQGVKLTAAESDDYAKHAGELLRTKIEELVADPEFMAETDGPDGVKSLFIQDVVRKVRALSRHRMIERTPSLRNRIDQRQALIEQNLLGKTTPRDMAISSPVLPVMEAPKTNRSVIDQLGGK